MATTFKKHSSVVIEDDDDKSSNVSDSEYESAENVAEELSNEENKYEEKEDYNSDSATEEDNENEENGDDQIENDANPGWADCMAKILKTKKSDNKSAVVLSKARKITDIKKKQKETADFEIVQSGEKRSAIDDLDKKLGPDNEEEPISKKRKEYLPHLRVKPNVLEKNREKGLSKIATKGVVQLFNAVRAQQKDLETKMVEAGQTERKKEKVLKSLDKSKFLDMLSNQKKKVKTETEIKDEVKKEEKSSWNVFRDDFMGNAKMKDWDKKEDSAENTDEMSDSSDE